MGRGLSTLQKTIIHEALKTRRLSDRAWALCGKDPNFGPLLRSVGTPSDFSHVEILACIVGWPRRGFCGEGKRGRVTGPPTRRDLPPKVYQSAYSALSRAIRRLKVRGLLEQEAQNGSYRLTEKGLEIAKGIRRDEILRRPDYAERRKVLG